MNNKQAELQEATAAARFNQKVKQAQAAHEAGDHKKAKYHLDTARNFMLGINSNDHSKIKDSYPKYKELRDLHKEEVDSLLEYESDLAKMKKADSYKVGDKIYTRVGGAWRKGHITTPLNKAGNHGVKFQHNGKTHSYVSHPDDLRLHVEEVELDEASWTAAASMHAATRKQPKGSSAEPNHGLRVGDKVITKKDKKEGTVHFVNGDNIHVKGINDYYSDHVTQYTSNDLKKIKEEIELDEAGAFSYGAKAPRKGSIAYNAMMKRKEQEKKSVPIEPKDQMVGTARVKVDEELTDKTIRQGDKIKVARVIADMLGVEKAESMSPEMAINTGLRMHKSKRMTPELVGVLKKMLKLAQDVGVKVDTNLLPKAVAEEIVDKNSSYNIAKGILSFDDFEKLKKMSSGEIETPSGEEPGGMGHTLHHQPHVRRMKVKYKTEEVDVIQTADYKTDKSGRKHRAHQIRFPGADFSSDQNNIKEQSDEYDMPDFSEDDLEDMANTIENEDHIIHLYDDDEIGVVDVDTGEEVDDEKLAQVDEEKLNEVLSRMERIKAKMRFARTAAKRSRRMQIALKRRSDGKTINKRSRRLAISMLKQKLMKKPANTLSVSEKERVERMLSSRKGLIDRLALKLAPRVRKIETDRLSHNSYTK